MLWARIQPQRVKKKSTGIDLKDINTCTFLEQDTGVEPAFTAWEAVVLPIYESCNWYVAL